MAKDITNFKEDFDRLPFSQQQFIRQIAVGRLKDYSFEEIGSSDVSNEMMTMYKSYGYNLQAILDDFSETYPSVLD
jgi:hypothetical protein